MGFVSEKSILTGLFGGYSTSKKGEHYLNVISEGPKVHKVRTQADCVIPSGVLFGTPVDAQLNMAEQKFSDFNGSFIEAQSVVIRVSQSLKVAA